MSNVPPWPSPLDPMIAALIQQYTTGTGQFAQMQSPYLDPAQQQQLYGTLPQTDEEGDPLSATQLGNLTQDYMDIAADPWSAALAGPQAYAVDAFDQTMSYNMIDDPNIRLFNTYLADPNSLSGRIAEGLQRGQSAETTIALLRDSIAKAMEAEGVENETEITDPALAPIIASLTPRYDQNNELVVGVNWESVGMQGRDITNTFAQRQQAGPVGAIYDDDGNVVSQGGEAVWMYDEQGQPILVEQTSKPSEASEWYTEQGLPLPTDTYEAEDFLGPEWHQAMADYVDYDPAIEETFAQLGNLNNQVDTLNPRSYAADYYRVLRELQGQATTAGQGAPPVAEYDSEAEREFEEMGDLPVDYYAEQYGGQPNPQNPGQRVQNPVPADEIPSPGYEYDPRGAATEDDLENWQPPTNEPGTVDELGGTYYGHDYEQPSIFDIQAEQFGAQPPSAPGSGASPYDPSSGRMTPAMTQAMLTMFNPAESFSPGPDYGMISATDQLQQQAAMQRQIEEQRSGMALTAAGNPQRTLQQRHGVYNIDQEEYLAQAMAEAAGAQRERTIANAPPPYARPGASPARQPGDSGYRAERINTGEAPLSEQLSRDERRSYNSETGSGVADYLRNLHASAPDRTSIRSRQRELVKARQQQNAAVFGADYGKALARAALLHQLGVTPLQQAQAARALPATAMGLPRGALPQPIGY